LMEEHRVTIGFGSPDLLESLTRSPRWPATDLSSIRFFITGGAPVPERLIRMYLERGVTFLQGYGLSEAAPFVSLPDAPSALRKFGSAGTPAPFVDVKAVRRDGSERAPDETGELLVRGPNVMVGDWRRPEATGAALVGDGWLRTGTRRASTRRGMRGSSGASPTHTKWAGTSRTQATSSARWSRMRRWPTPGWRHATGPRPPSSCSPTASRRVRRSCSNVAGLDCPRTRCRRRLSSSTICRGALSASCFATSCPWGKSPLVRGMRGAGC